MIALDTNFLVYAHRIDSPQHDRAYAIARELMLGLNLQLAIYCKAVTIFGHYAEIWRKIFNCAGANIAMLELPLYVWKTLLLLCGLSTAISVVTNSLGPSTHWPR
jgi:hypothetical protein